MATQASTLRIPTTDLLPVPGKLNRLQETLHLEVSEHTYTPKIGMFKHDWVASLALPAFHAYAGEHGYGAVRSFCSVGTGAGVDALAALESFELSRIAVTDIHADVADSAVRNIARNCREAGISVKIDGYTGDLLRPLMKSGKRFDLIYENLPNIPAPESVDIWREQNSSSFISRAVSSESSAAAAQPAREGLLELHCALLEQARPLLSPRGRVLCSIGCRTSLDTIRRAIEGVGYRPHPLAFTWKVQTEAEDVVSGYAEHESHGFGPFHFYPLSILVETFREISPAQAACSAWELEERLRPWELTAVQARKIILAGGEVGHTAIVMEATPAAS